VPRECETAAPVGNRPVKAPRTCPNSSDSSSVVGSAVQFTGTKGSAASGELKWIALAMSSLPVPVSPRMSTLARFAASWPTSL